MENEIKMMTEFAVLKNQLTTMDEKITEIVKGYKAQWDKLDGHGNEIVRLDTKFKLLGGLIVVFGPLVGGIVSAIVSRVVH